jgi:hypothetical protein
MRLYAGESHLLHRKGLFTSALLIINTSKDLGLNSQRQHCKSPCLSVTVAVMNYHHFLARIQVLWIKYYVSWVDGWNIRSAGNGDAINC